ncbi:MAG: molybdopterin-dependent oxidoreductase [Proteobacteria bacterium]|nr:molybdopterin-dependent oxidoreductase [Pseudomonadota bacterium]
MTTSRRRLLQAGGALAGTAVASHLGIGVWKRVDRGPAWGQQIPFLTPQDEFYNRFDARKFDPKYYWVRLTDRERFPHRTRRPDVPWMLAIDGAVSQPFELSERGVRHAGSELGIVHLLKTLRCTGDGPDFRLASNGVWTGVRLRPILRRAGPPRDVTRLRIYGEDGFTANLRWDHLITADGREAMLAWELNGEPLSERRGGPVRLIVPDRYGFKNIKWPVRIEVTTEDVAWGNHEADLRVGLDPGVVELGSKLLDPDIRKGRAEVRTKERRLVLRGSALPAVGALERVQISIDGAPWADAKIDVPAELTEHDAAAAAHAAAGHRWPLPDVWVHWWFPWDAPGPGRYEVRVRATGAGGMAQPAHDKQRLDGDSRIANCVIEIA